MLPLPSYVVVTPARNEDKFLEKLILSMRAQTVAPLKWVIVNDGSTDGTLEIATRHARQCEWIEVLNLPAHPNRDFSGKVFAIRAGLERVQNLPYQAFACIDADINFEADYFQFLLQKLAEDSALGMVGTAFHEAGVRSYNYNLVGIEHISGGCQLFRRQCYEQIGGYQPIKAGAVDLVAVTMARMQGWKTRTFTEKLYEHARHMGTAQNCWVCAKFKYGRKDYLIGNHPLWEFPRALYQMARKPYLIGGASLLAGYLCAALCRTKRLVPAEFVAFRRHEQLQRLRHLLRFGQKTV